MLLFLASVFLPCVCHTTAQVSHTVTVGYAGSFYDPPTISAEENDTITYIFAAGLHGVTQSTYEDPCLPLEEGFNSGLIGPGGDNSGPVYTWTMVVSNASYPIWYYCQSVVPASHCAAGMVGVINPPSIDSFNTFVSVAKGVTGTPSPTPTVVLSGSGAYAINSPTTTILDAAVSVSTTDAAVASLSSLYQSIRATVTVSSQPTNSPPGPNVSAIAGGTIGGVAAAVIIGVLMFFLLRERRKRLGANSNLTANEEERGTVEKPPVTTLPNALPASTVSSPTTRRDPFGPSSSPNLPVMAQLQGQRYPTSANEEWAQAQLPTLPVQRENVRAAAHGFESPVRATFANSQLQPQPHAEAINIRDLAQEVVNLLHQQKDRPVHATGSVPHTNIGVGAGSQYVTMGTGAPYGGPSDVLGSPASPRTPGPPRYEA